MHQAEDNLIDFSLRINNSTILSNKNLSIFFHWLTFKFVSVCLLFLGNRRQDIIYCSRPLDIIHYSLYSCQHLKSLRKLWYLSFILFIHLKVSLPCMNQDVQHNIHFLYLLNGKQYIYLGYCHYFYMKISFIDGLDYIKPYLFFHSY